MTTFAATTPRLSSYPPVAVRRFTVDEYHRMEQCGVLTERDRVELLEGWIVSKMVHGARHDATVDQVHELIRAKLPAEWRIRIQSAITTDESEPEPDLAVVTGPASRYSMHHPRPADIQLVVEVADSSLDEDRGLKARIYARAGIPVYWIVNLVDRQIEVHANPSGPGSSPEYRLRRILTIESQLDLVVDGQDFGSLSTRELLSASS
jgi:Uma2 family endonuclease